MSAKRFFNKMGQGAKRFFNKDVGANAQKLFSKGGQAEQIGKKALGITDDVLRVGGQIVKGIGQASNQLAPVLGPEFKGLGGVINKIGKASGQVGNALDKAAYIEKKVIQAVKKPSLPSMNEMQPQMQQDDLNFA